jgi:hypothetical protein
MNMNKKVLLIVGGLAVAGVVIYLITKGKNTEDSSGTKSDIDKSISDLTKKEAKKEIKDICRDKYGFGLKSFQCRQRVKKGGVAFDGGFMDDFADDNFGL